jgi:hypothetical protein
MKQENRHIDFSEELEFATEVDVAEKVTEESQSKTAPKQVQDIPNRKIRVKELIDGTFLVRENVIKQIPFLLFLTFLGVIYIGNRFHAEKRVRQIEQLKVEVANLRSEQITTTSELMNISRPSEVAALVESKGLGLKESMEPPKKLKR